MAGPILKALCRLLTRERTTAGDHKGAPIGINLSLEARQEAG